MTNAALDRFTSEHLCITKPRGNSTSGGLWTMTAAIRHDIRANCPPKAVWALLGDLEAVQRYNPTVRSASIEGTQRSGVGAMRSCELVPDGRVVERVTHWEDGRAVGLEIAESD